MRAIRFSAPNNKALPMAQAFPDTVYVLRARDFPVGVFMAMVISMISLAGVAGVLLILPRDRAEG